MCMWTHFRWAIETKQEFSTPDASRKDSVKQIKEYVSRFVGGTYSRWVIETKQEFSTPDASRKDSVKQFKECVSKFLGGTYSLFV